MVAMAPAAKPVLRKLRRVVGLIVTSAGLKPVGEPDQWMLARMQPQWRDWIVPPGNGVVLVLNSECWLIAASLPLDP